MTQDSSSLATDIERLSPQINNLAQTSTSIPEFLRAVNAILNVDTESMEGLIGAPSGYISGIYKGKKPTLTFIHELSGALHLSDEASDRLVQIRNFDSHSQANQSSWISSYSNTDIARLDSEVKQLVDLIRNAESSPDTVSTALKDEIEQAAERIIETGQRLAAPIRLPSTSDMEVRLASIGQLERLDEYRGNLNLFSSLASATLGAIIGIAINWITSNPIAITKPSIVAFVILGLGLSIFGMLTYRESQRVNRIRTSILGTGQPNTDKEKGDDSG